MNHVLDHVMLLLGNLRMPPIDFDAVFAGRNNLTPLEIIELFLLEEQRIRTEKQNVLRRKRANLPAEKTLASFDFGFQRSVSKEQMLRLSDMTWVEQVFNVCFLGPPGVGKTHLALSLSVKALDLGYSVAFETLDNLMKHLKTEEISGVSKRRMKHIRKAALVVIDEVGFMPLSPGRQICFSVSSHLWPRGRPSSSRRTKGLMNGRNSSATRRLLRPSSTGLSTAVKSST